MSHPNYSLCSNLLVKSVIQDEHQTIKLKRTDASYTAGTLQGSHKDVACSCNASSLDAPLANRRDFLLRCCRLAPYASDEKAHKLDRHSDRSLQQVSQPHRETNCNSHQNHSYDCQRRFGKCKIERFDYLPKIAN